VDFSISQASLPQVQGVQELVDEVRDKLILACESELVSNLAKIQEDRLKLVDTSAPLKILLYPSNRQLNARQERKWAIERILNNNESRTLHVDSQWLFMGIPLFREWVRRKGDIPSFRPRIYRSRFKPDEPLEEQYELRLQHWWDDEPKPLRPAAG
jgi:hypothetical protein